jgi:hypothetical protein
MPVFVLWQGTDGKGLMIQFWQEKFFISLAFM